MLSCVSRRSREGITEKRRMMCSHVSHRALPKGWTRHVRSVCVASGTAHSMRVGSRGQRAGQGDGVRTGGDADRRAELRGSAQAGGKGAVWRDRWGRPPGDPEGRDEMSSRPPLGPPRAPVDPDDSSFTTHTPVCADGEATRACRVTGELTLAARLLDRTLKVGERSPISPGRSSIATPNGCSPLANECRERPAPARHGLVRPEGHIRPARFRTHSKGLDRPSW